MSSQEKFEILADTLAPLMQEPRDHSPAPWTIRDNIGDVLIAVDANGNDTQIMADLQHDPEVGINGDPEGAAADMRRIVACVNACEGLDIGILEAMSSGDLPNIEDGFFRCAEKEINLLRQRDELLAALKQLVGVAKEAMSLCQTQKGMMFQDLAKDIGKPLLAANRAIEITEGGQ